MICRNNIVNNSFLDKDASPSRNNSESIPLEDDVSREESDLNKKPSLSLKQNVSNSEGKYNTQRLLYRSL